VVTYTTPELTHALTNRSAERREPLGAEEQQQDRENDQAVF
jgi:hypothetical protein